MSIVAERLAVVQQEIATLCARYGRPRDAVNLMAVSKTKPAQMIREARAEGVRDFGENYLQEAVAKIESIADPGIVWHFIGPLQSNKTRPVATHFDWVHSVGSARIARRLDRHAGEARDRPLDICIQVNISEEAAKSGVTPAELEPLLEEILGCEHLAPRGLMAIPAPAASIEAQRAPFRALRLLQERCREKYDIADFTELSMGMSADLEAAIAEGATWVRLGTAIFGARD